MDVDDVDRPHDRPVGIRVARTYEIWLITGEWYGSGDWPPPRTSTDMEICRSFKT